MAKVTPCAPKVYAVLTALFEELNREYGCDYAITVVGRGHILARSNQAGVLMPESENAAKVLQVEFVDNTPETSADYGDDREDKKG